MTDPMPPTAVDSERAVLAACLRSEVFYRETAALLADDEWYVNAHGELWAMMRQLDSDGVKLDASAIAAVASRRSTGHANLVADLVTTPYDATGTVAWHCARITEAATSRDYQVVLRRALQHSDSDRSAVDLAEQTIEQLRLVQLRSLIDTRTAVDVLDLVRRPDTSDDWIIPDLLARGDRLVLTAPEGYGKSTLLRQLAGATAAGLHPFWPDGIEPRRVLVYDCENPEKINRHAYRNLLSYLEAIGQLPERGMLTVDMVGPTNLLDARDAARFLSTVDDVKPDLIITGPIYQLHDGNPNDEEPAKKVARVLDRARLMHNSALVTEAHTPHSDDPSRPLMRPYGASLWKRWPEFGYCLHPVKGADVNKPGEAGHIARAMRESQLTPWRGAREQRRWPLSLCAGSRFPWQAS